MMNPRDKSNLSFQFKIKIFLKNGIEFQSFFEDIMEKSFIDFQKIKPYGNRGDAGNDGYRKNSGIYYQVYAPNTPKVNEQNAVKKMQEDFQKLKDGWNEISNIKEYYFVFNDKYDGSIQSLENGISTLKANNPDIDFKLFLAKDLEGEFFRLSDADILSLGFNIDQRQALSHAYDFLNYIKIELDRENAIFAQKLIDNIRDIISALAEDNLSLEFELLECKCLQKFERIKDVKERFEDIVVRHPDDSRPLLYLAELYLNEKNYDSNFQLLVKAEKVDANNWQLKLAQLVRNIHLGEKVDTKILNEVSNLDDPRIKGSFYRLFGLIFDDQGDKVKADQYISLAIHINPDRFINYIAKLSVLKNRLLSTQDPSQRQMFAQELLEELEDLEDKFVSKGNMGSRSLALLNSIKLPGILEQLNITEYERVSKETYKVLMNCYFDKQIEQIIVDLIKYISLPIYELEQLLNFLKRSKVELSDDLCKVLVFQFDIKNSLISEGKLFFEEINNKSIFELICAIEIEDYEKVGSYLVNDIQMAVVLAKTLGNFPNLRSKIIENLPDEIEGIKVKLSLLLNFDQKDSLEAFQIIKQLDISKLNYFECRSILTTIHNLEAWDFEIIILEKLIAQEKNENEKNNLKLQLFNAYVNLKKFSEVIDIGEQLLEEDSSKLFLDQMNQEVVLSNTIIAHFERGKIDKGAFTKAKELLEKYRKTDHSFGFKVGIEAEVYLNIGEVEIALDSIVTGVKNKKLFTPQEYARLFFLLSVRIGNQINLNQEPSEKVHENSFIKLVNRDQWYFLGEGNELDALPIRKINEKYSLFIDKFLGEKIVIDNKYGIETREEQIEIIFPVEKYIFWQSIKNFQKLSRDGDLEGVQIVNIPQTEDAIDPRYLIQLLDDLQKKTEPMFEMYCQNNLPLALLAVTEGGLPNAIGRIQQEGKGYINFSSGSLSELQDQKEIAKTIIDQKKPFYIDATSALVLSETGLLQKIYKNCPNIRIAQSVINLLVDITDKFRYLPGQAGILTYSQGKMSIATLEKEKRDLIQSKFIASIKLLESNPNNIQVISLANKLDSLSEKRIPAELCDSCILAQKEGIPILTEDFLYLKMNELETKKKAPVYFSSIVLVKILYEEEKISFNEYLEFFSYLSSYRFRFLTLNAEDIEKAIFGEGVIKIVKPENIRMFNFSLTLSEEYGVPFQTGFSIVGVVLTKVMTDDTITVEIAEQIFLEILEAFPTKMRKQEFGQFLLMSCNEVIESKEVKRFLYYDSHLLHLKFDKLLKATEIYSSELRILK